MEVDKDDEIKILFIIPLSFGDLDFIVIWCGFVEGLGMFLMLGEFSKKLLTIVGLGFGLWVERH